MPSWLPLCLEINSAVAANTPRGFSVAQQQTFVEHLRRFHGVSVDIFVIAAPTADAAPFANSLLKLLLASQWNARGVSNLLSGIIGTGILVSTRAEPNVNDRAAAAALLNELHAYGVAAEPGAIVTDDVVKVLGAYVGPDLTGTHSNLWIVVGSKP